MKFRHNLAKETFKGKKKNTERGVEDLIDPDQRGNQSSAEVETNILSLDKETITPEPVAEEPREMSRRDIFSFGNFLDFGNGTLGDWGVHWLDQVLWWTEEKAPKYVYSTGGRRD